MEQVDKLRIWLNSEFRNNKKEILILRLFTDLLIEWIPLASLSLFSLSFSLLPQSEVSPDEILFSFLSLSTISPPLRFSVSFSPTTYNSIEVTKIGLHFANPSSLFIISWIWEQVRKKETSSTGIKCQFQNKNGSGGRFLPSSLFYVLSFSDSCLTTFQLFALFFNDTILKKCIS